MSEIRVTDAAKRMGVGRVALLPLLNGTTGISPEMALRLPKALGTSPEFWYGMQVSYDLGPYGVLCCCSNADFMMRMLSLISAASGVAPVAAIALRCLLAMAPPTNTGTPDLRTNRVSAS